MWYIQLVSIAGIVASIAASSATNFQEIPNAHIQPQNAAFSIWGVIFPSLLLSSVLFAGTAKFPAEPSLCVTCGLLMTVLWSLSMRLKYWWLSFSLLFSCALCNWVATGLTPFDTKDPQSWIVQLSISTFAGWTTAASAINLAIADRTLDNHRSLLVVAFCISVVCVCIKRPLPCIAYIWALAFQGEQTVWTTSAMAMTAAAGGWSLYSQLASVPVETSVSSL